MRHLPCSIYAHFIMNKYSLGFGITAMYILDDVGNNCVIKKMFPFNLLWKYLLL